MSDDGGNWDDDDWENDDLDSRLESLKMEPIVDKQVRKRGHFLLFRPSSPIIYGTAATSPLSFNPIVAVPFFLPSFLPSRIERNECGGDTCMVFSLQ
jgi:hypothetical protein